MIVSAQKAAELIRAGHVVAIPTETVYGLAADASNVLAVRKIFDLKHRPADNPLIVHIAGASQVAVFSDVKSSTISLLIDQFWPGPLTLVLPKKPTVLDIITAGLDTVAIRMPDHPKALSVIEMSGPVAAPSANRSGRPSPTRPEHVAEDFEPDLPIVDGGACTVGLESTVLDMSGETPTILRPGKITANEIEDVLGIQVKQTPSNQGQSRRSPGTRYTHYKPNAAVKWMTSQSFSSHESECLYIYHTKCPEERSSNIICFDENFEEFARSLYDLYRTADRQTYDTILIEPLPEDHSTPLIPALFNRIQRSITQ